MRVGYMYREAGQHEALSNSRGAANSAKGKSFCSDEQIFISVTSV